MKRPSASTYQIYRLCIVKTARFLTHIKTVLSVTRRIALNRGRRDVTQESRIMVISSASSSGGGGETSQRAGQLASVDREATATVRSVGQSSCSTHTSSYPRRRRRRHSSSSSSVPSLCLLIQVVARSLLQSSVSRRSISEHSAIEPVHGASCVHCPCPLCLSDCMSSIDEG